MAQRRSPLSREETGKRIYRYCAYQERSHLEVRNKLREYGCTPTETDEWIVRLIAENFLNEERFARAFSGGRFRMKHWGRHKISAALHQKGLSDNCIALGLSEIDEDEYVQVLTRLLEEKALHQDEPNIYTRRHKLSQYGIRKGFEPELVWEVIGRLFPK